MKRILVVTNNLMIGGEAAALFALTKRWYGLAQITIAHFGSAVEYDFDDSIEIISLLGKDLQQPSVFVRNYLNVRRTAFWQELYNQKLAGASFDLVIAYGMVFPFLLVGLGAPQKVAKLAWFHNDPAKARFGLIHSKRLFGKAVARFDNTVAVASHVAGKVQQLYGIEPEVIYNYFECSKRSEEVVERSAKYELLFVGRLVEQKGLGDALEWLRPVNADNHLHIVGDGPLRKELEKQARGMAVTFWGTQTDVTAFYQSVDALLLPSHFEGLPTVALEAKCFGLPILARELEYLADLPADEIYQVDSALKLAHALPKMKPAAELVWDNRKIDEQLAKYFRK